MYALYAFFEYVLIAANIAFNFVVFMSLPDEAALVIAKTSHLAVKKDATF